MNASNASASAAAAAASAARPRSMGASAAEDGVRLPDITLATLVAAAASFLVVVCWLCIRALRDVAIAQERIRASAQEQRERLSLQDLQDDPIAVSRSLLDPAYASDPHLQRMVREGLASAAGALSDEDVFRCAARGATGRLPLEAPALPAASSGRKLRPFSVDLA